jgi:anti-anti-sigma factor
VSAEPPGQPRVFEATLPGETVAVVLRGEFDMTSEGFLYSRLSRIREMRPRRLIFEMAQVTYLDCAAARLVASTRDWLPVGVKPVVRRPSPVVRRLLQASGIGASCDLEL